MVLQVLESYACLKLVVDLECNSLNNPTKVWLAVCKNIDSGELYIFRNLTEDKDHARDLGNLLRSADTIIGHNWLGYDYPILARLLGIHLKVQLLHVLTRLLYPN